MLARKSQAKPNVLIELEDGECTRYGKALFDIGQKGEATDNADDADYLLLHPRHPRYRWLNSVIYAAR
jgi:hypothetical protein